MKRYTARTVQDAVNTACQELGVTIDELNYEAVSYTHLTLPTILLV